MDLSTFLFTLLLASPADPLPGHALVVSPANAVPDSTGIEGIVYSVTGNQMPSPDHPPGKRARKGIRSTVYIFELTNIRQVAGPASSPCFTAVNTRLIGKANTDEKGYFKLLLPPGRYSVFTKKGDLYCAGRRDDKNNIAPVDVLPGKMTRVDCRVESDHAAVY
ncbi:MAG: carboxypeptidase regulatory-like domain-containing protein [Bacteroidota bacterium]|nr:carboxypeptidase regulatory-like domain-containing protein [Bacteroidota bacterium]MDP4216264.1 carboxypeptidase regulatory-like domain-containing protein [Bacteroidota bacterium]MDP4253107.1 carboxypeptidase regulatory-like domain-containing protein [Bacteroidota bacterium]MDP4259996.1 carboxypeptidase regulatory-like domain-containing protein [Bacteroidota bacterium]